MSTAAKKEKMSVRHMLVVLTGIMITFGCSALCFSTWGLFQPVVAEGLGVEITAFAMYVTVMYLTMTVASPFAGKLIQSMDIRIILTISACLVGGAFILMSFSYNIIMFYVAAVLLGLGEISILWLAIPQLINRWFAERAGFFIGLCMAFTGIGGVVFNLVGGAFIASGPDGWRMGYLVFGIIALVMALPFTLFCVRSYPHDIGLEPVGASEAASAAPGAGANASAAEGVTASTAMKTSAFFLVAIFAGFINLAINFYQYLPSYATSLTPYPDVVAISATLASAAMLGQAIGKVLLGIINDKVNVYAGLFVSTGCGAIGLAVMWLVPGSVPAMLAGGFVFGVFYASATVLAPLMVRTIFGTLEYSTIYSRVAMVGSLAGAFAASVWGFVVDAAGFSNVFIIGIAGAILVAVFGVLALNARKKIPARK